VSDRPPGDGAGPAPVRVFNRSDRVWVYGFVRMAPLLLLFVGLATLLFFHQHFKRLPDEVAVPLVFVCLIGAFVLDRWPGLNPVNYVGLSADLEVTRLAGRPRGYPPDRVVRVELAPREGEEYDDRKPARGGIDVTVRVRRAWPVRMLVSPRDAQVVAAWARGHGKPVHESSRPGHAPE
jgi:hypothetical protein